MIAIRRDRLPAVVDLPWLEVGPLREGRGEWRHTAGVALSIGRTTWAVRWRRGSSEPVVDAVTAGLALVGQLLGRLR